MRPAALLRLCVLFLFSLTAMAQADGFGSFKRDDLSAPKTAGKIKDPTGASPASPVYGFRLPAGYCNAKPYEPGGKESDCFYGSARSQMVESGKKQPGEAWYGWYVYFPKDFPYGGKQTKGHYEFAYWHNKQCPHLSFANDAGAGDMLYLQSNKALGNYDCEPVSKQPIISFKRLLGKWTRFETHVIWSSGSNGLVEVYVDGKLAVTRKGPNLVKGFEGTNYFKFGAYLCCTGDAAQIREASVYFSGVKRASDREGLN